MRVSAFLLVVALGGAVAGCGGAETPPAANSAASPTPAPGGAAANTPPQTLSPEAGQAARRVMVGVWKGSQALGTAELEFKADGTYHMEMEQPDRKASMEQDGTYELLGGTPDRPAQVDLKITAARQTTGTEKRVLSADQLAQAPPLHQRIDWTNENEIILSQEENGKPVEGESATFRRVLK